MNKLLRLLRYDWPLHFILLFTNWLPDNVLFLRLRGWLVHWFFGKCGNNLRLSRAITVLNPSCISLGANVYLGYGCVLLSVGKIIIEDEVMLGPYVVVSAGNHSRKDFSFRYGRILDESITIDRGTWIGSHVSILGGSHIGKGSMVGSNACVTRGSFPDNAFLVGVPAKVKKYLDGEDDRD